MQPASVNVRDVSNMSDHSLVSCSLNSPNLRTSQQSVKLRNFKRIDNELLSAFLIQSPFQNIIYLSDINQKVSYLNDLILNIFDTLAPCKTIVFKRPKPPWLTDNIQAMIKLKDKAFNKCQKTNNPVHWDFYKQLRNQTNIAVSNEKKRYLEFLVNHDNSSKILWKKLSELKIYNKSSTFLIPEILNKPNQINDYFLQYSKNVKCPDQNLITSYSQNIIQNKYSFSFNTVTIAEVENCLADIKSGASGPDLTNLEMIKLCCPIILPYITNIINSCLLDSVVPDIWKVSSLQGYPCAKEK